MKKLSKTALRKKCDILASKYYRAKTPYCELSGKDNIACGGVLQWCHIFTRSIYHMRYEPYNNLILCQGHHLFFTHHPIEWTRILEKEYPERLAEAEKNRNLYWKVDYQEWIDKFKEYLDVRD